MSDTPILDCEAPLPPRVQSRSAYAVIVVSWSVLAMLIVVGLSVERPPFVRPWILALQRVSPLVMALASIAVVIAIMVVHELGHVLGGLAVGFRFRSLRIGPILVDRRFRVSIVRHGSIALTGAAVVTPATADDLVRRGVVLVVAGPLANILAGSIALLLWSSNVFWVGFAVASIANGLTDLIPFRGPVGPSDGMALGMFAGHPAKGERWLSLIKLRDDLMNGTLPESTSAAFLQKAVAIEDASVETLAAHAFAYAKAFHLHEDARAAEMLEICLRRAGPAPPELREALASDAAVFQARRRGRPDLAKRWLEAMTAAPNSWLRLRAEAAILQAEGHRDGASDKLAECERAIALALPAGPLRELSLQLVRRWQAELA